MFFFIFYCFDFQSLIALAQRVIRINYIKNKSCLCFYALLDHNIPLLSTFD